MSEEFNLTKSEGVVRLRPDCRPLSGHSLVIMNGGKYHETLAPDVLFRPGWFQGDKYIAYAVNTERELETRVVEEINFKGSRRKFTIKINIRYKVIDPKRLVAYLADDPLSKLREKSIKIFTSNLWFLDWEDVLTYSPSFRNIFSIELPTSADIIRTGRQELEADTLGFGLEILWVNHHPIFSDETTKIEDLEDGWRIEQHKLDLKAQGEVNAHRRTITINQTKIQVGQLQDQVIAEKGQRDIIAKGLSSYLGFVGNAQSPGKVEQTLKSFDESSLNPKNRNSEEDIGKRLTSKERVLKIRGNKKHDDHEDAKEPADYVDLKHDDHALTRVICGLIGTVAAIPSSLNSKKALVGNALNLLGAMWLCEHDLDDDEQVNLYRNSLKNKMRAIKADVTEAQQTFFVSLLKGDLTWVEIEASDD